jgi:hypothetical protein
VVTLTCALSRRNHGIENRQPLPAHRMLGHSRQGTFAASLERECRLGARLETEAGVRSWKNHDCAREYAGLGWLIKVQVVSATGGVPSWAFVCSTYARCVLICPRCRD